MNHHLPDISSWHKLPDEYDPLQHLTRQQVADLLQVDPSTVSRWMHSGELPYTRVGEKPRILRKDVHDYILKRRMQ